MLESEHKPADCMHRGTLPCKLQDHRLWWIDHGHLYLQLSGLLKTHPLLIVQQPVEDFQALSS